MTGQRVNFWFHHKNYTSQFNKEFKFINDNRIGLGLPPLKEKDLHNYAYYLLFTNLTSPESPDLYKLCTENNVAEVIAIKDLERS